MIIHGMAWLVGRGLDLLMHASNQLGLYSYKRLQSNMMKQCEKRPLQLQQEGGRVYSMCSVSLPNESSGPMLFFSMPIG